MTTRPRIGVQSLILVSFVVLLFVLLFIIVRGLVPIDIMLRTVLIFLSGVFLATSGFLAYLSVERSTISYRAGTTIAIVGSAISFGLFLYSFGATAPLVICAGAIAAIGTLIGFRVGTKRLRDISRPN